MIDTTTFEEDDFPELDGEPDGTELDTTYTTYEDDFSIGDLYA